MPGRLNREMERINIQRDEGCLFSKITERQQIIGLRNYINGFRINMIST